jgi:3-hydroxyisobutyrate dehydrogenase
VRAIHYARAMRIGVVGVGAVGQAVAHRLSRPAGWPVQVWSRTARRVELGPEVRQRHDLSGLLAESDVVLVCLRDHRAIRETLPAALANCRTGGASHPLTDDRVLDVILVTTMSPSAARAVAEELPRTTSSGRQVHVCDGPVVGNVTDLGTGRAQVLVGGDRDTWKRVQALLATLGEARYVGGLGQGAALKVVVNAAVAPMMAMVAQAYALADRLGLDRSMVLDVLLHTRVGNLVERKRSMIEADEYPTSSGLSNHAKDLRMILDLAGEVGAPMGVVAAAEALAQRAVDEGNGELDYAALVRLCLHHVARPPDASS